jgi:hypothetical protein
MTEQERDVARMWWLLMIATSLIALLTIWAEVHEFKTMLEDGAPVPGQTQMNEGEKR